jgi:hypothetical protein
MVSSSFVDAAKREAMASVFVMMFLVVARVRRHAKASTT